MSELESDIEAAVIEWVEDQGGYSLKLKIENERGWPDQTIWLPEGRVIVPELKRPKKNDGGSVNQKKWVRRLTALGFATGFCESLEEVKRLLD